MTDEQAKNICPLWIGGKCPICDDEWCDYGISYEEGEEWNRLCCETHYHPTGEDIDEIREWRT